MAESKGKLLRSESSPTRAIDRRYHSPVRVVELPATFGLDLLTDPPASRCERSSRARALTTPRSEEHTSELQSHSDLVCRLLLEKKKSTHEPTAAAPFIKARQPHCIDCRHVAWLLSR